MGVVPHWGRSSWSKGQHSKGQCVELPQRVGQLAQLPPPQHLPALAVGQGGNILVKFGSCFWPGSSSTVARAHSYLQTKSAEKSKPDWVASSPSLMFELSLVKINHGLHLLLFILLYAPVGGKMVM